MTTKRLSITPFSWTDILSTMRRLAVPGEVSSFSTDLAMLVGAVEASILSTLTCLEKATGPAGGWFPASNEDIGPADEPARITKYLNKLERLGYIETRGNNRNRWVRIRDRVSP